MDNVQPGKKKDGEKRGVGECSACEGGKNEHKMTK